MRVGELNIIFLNKLWEKNQSITRFFFSTETMTTLFLLIYGLTRFIYSVLNESPFSFVVKIGRKYWNLVNSIKISNQLGKIHWFERKELPHNFLVCCQEILYVWKNNALKWIRIFQNFEMNKIQLTKTLFWRVPLT